MGVEIKLTDRDLPVSPVMIEFLDDIIERRDRLSNWSDQISEALVPAEAEAQLTAARVAVDKVLSHPIGQRAIYRAYELLTAMLIGSAQKLREVHERYRFVCIVGCARHGGSYLTSELFSALGYEVTRVPPAIAHDGFPNLTPFALDDRLNTNTTAVQQIAEYLAMVEVYFANSRRVNGYTIVPKKFTKAVYQGGLVSAALGPAAEFIVTLRHPVAACISTYEKSSGLPLDGRFHSRSNIEEWVKRDLAWQGMSEGDILRGDYFDIYLKYWELYHFRLAMSGLAGSRNFEVVVYGKERLTSAARDLHIRVGSDGAPKDFMTSNNRARHLDWNARALPSIERVADFWRSLGLPFPVEELLEGW